MLLQFYSRCLYYSMHLLRLSIVCILLNLNLVVPAFAEDESYTIDPGGSRVNFTVTHMGITHIHGTFGDFLGAIRLTGTNLTGAVGIVKSKSINAGESTRNAHLLSVDFFDVLNFPTICFSSKSGGWTNKQFYLTGDLAIKGVSKEVCLPITMKGPIKDIWGKRRIGLETKLVIDRRDYGISWNKILPNGDLFVSEQVEIDLSIEAFKR